MPQPALSRAFSMSLANFDVVRSTPWLPGCREWHFRRCPGDPGPALWTERRLTPVRLDFRPFCRRLSFPFRVTPDHSFGEVGAFSQPLAPGPLVHSRQGVPVPSASFLPPGTDFQDLAILRDSECSRTDWDNTRRECNRRRRQGLTFPHVCALLQPVFGSLRETAE